MKNFIIVTEIKHYTTNVVQADDRAEALRKFRDPEGDFYFDANSTLVQVIELTPEQAN